MQSSHFITHLDLIPHPGGGYFREFYRSGSVPMTTCGETDFNVATKTTTNKTTPELVTNANGGAVANGDNDGRIPYEALCVASYREGRRPDKDPRRNCVTSVIWMPTDESPVMKLGVNLSDQVHYWQGGKAFEYITYDPETGSLTREILGSRVERGEKMQVIVRGGLWKCGRLLDVGGGGVEGGSVVDFCLIGEAVAPGFDKYDFSVVTEEQVVSVANDEDRKTLLQFLDKMDA